jgi:hypothetical protein
MLPCGARSSDRLDFFIIGIHVLVPYVMGLGLISLFLILFLVFLDLILWYKVSCTELSGRGPASRGPGAVAPLPLLWAGQARGGGEPPIGSLPRNWGFGSQKYQLARCLVSNNYSTSRRLSCGVSPSAPWYVSNVSIIIMLHACITSSHIRFAHTSLHFYTFSGTNLLTRCHSDSSLFSVVLYFRKVAQEIFS